MSRKTPFSEAAPEAIDAVIRHPQAALRYYQKVSVSDEGPPVISGGRQVLDGVDQGIAVSGFVYVAVEGRMFYIQFVRTALTPIRGEYQIIDTRAARSAAGVAWVALKTMWAAIIFSPAGIYEAIRTWWRERRYEKEFSPSDGSVFGDFGAQVSVRELGAAGSFGTHIRELDVEKYTRIIERLLMDTVLDFLAEKGVDISAFANSAASIIDGDVYHIETVSGGQNQFGRESVYNEAPAGGTS